jgi:hypothetical protein
MSHAAPFGRLSGTVCALAVLFSLASCATRYEPPPIGETSANVAFTTSEEAGLVQAYYFSNETCDNPQRIGVFSKTPILFSPFAKMSETRLSTKVPAGTVVTMLSWIYNTGPFSTSCRMTVAFTAMPDRSYEIEFDYNRKKGACSTSVFRRVGEADRIREPTATRSARQCRLATP